MKAEYTQGSIAAMMLKTAVAMFASTLAMCGYNIADTYYVGHLGGEAPLAAMGFTFPVVMLLGCIFHGVSGGCMTTMAHAIGRNDSKEANTIVSGGMLLLVLISLLLGGLGIATADSVYPLMGARNETLLLLKRYMSIWFYGCVTASLSMAGNSLLVAAGRPRLASAMNIVGMFINVLLDPILIFGGASIRAHLTSWLPEGLHCAVHLLLAPFACIPKMGIAGAAIATVASQAASACVMLWILRRVGLLSFKKIPMDVLLRTWKLIVTYAIPATLGMLLIPVSQYVVTWITAQFGDSMVAAVAASGKLELMAFILPMAFGIPLMPIIAQNYSARLYGRVRFAFHFSSLVAFSYLTAISIVFMLIAPKLVGLFSPEATIQQKMIVCMHIVPWGYGILELTRYTGFLMVGCGHPKLDATLKVVRTVCLLLPCALLTHFLRWEKGIFFTRLFTDVVGGMICLAFAWRILRRLPEQDGEQLE